MAWMWTGAVALFAATQVTLLLFSAHRLLTLWRWHRRERATPGTALESTAWPSVTVQLPVFNERAVVERLIDAAARLEYPAERLQIQVLDDSTDETCALAYARVEYWRSRGRDIELLHREARTGFKAGALAAGLATARSEFVAIFDADFVPEPDFLRRVLPRFAPGVGMVQARWGHLNRDASVSTAAQAVLLDAHFLLEHEARMAAGLFFNFNGTAGVWRRACIEDAGGWAHDTLTEDLDLSYRAQLRGWRFVSAADIVVPGELPEDMLALKSQQRRWAKGSIQTARKILPLVWASRLPLRVKLEAGMHLTANFTYALLLLSALLLPVVLMLPSTMAWQWSLALDLSAIVAGVLPIVWFLETGRHAAGKGSHQRWRELLSALVMSSGLTLNNTLAVLGGLRPGLGDWDRTPKSGDRSDDRARRPYAARRDPGTALEVLLAAYFAAVVVYALLEGRFRSLPFPLLLAVGLGTAGIRSLRESGARRLRRAPAATPAATPDAQPRRLRTWDRALRRPTRPVEHPESACNAERAARTHG